MVEEDDGEHGVSDREQRAYEERQSDEPPSAARRTARMPQVGASTQASGWIHPGNSDSGISIR